MARKNKDNKDLDYEKIAIYPFDYDTELRRKLPQYISDLVIRFYYEQC